MVTWSSLGVKQAVKFWDPSNPANSFSPQINPLTVARTPGTVRKYIKTTNGTSVISGDREYPPLEIQLSWDQIDYQDYLGLAAFTAIDPIVFCDNNNQGYLGVLVIDKAGQVAGKTKNVWAIQAAFLVIGPYNGVTGTINNLAPPTLSVTNHNTGGYITASSTIYLWPTVFTPWGESTVGSMLTYSVPSGTNTNYGNISWTQPGNSYFTKLRLYWSSANNPANATLLTEVQAGQTGTFNLYSNYVAYSTTTPPTYTTAFTGYWMGALWQQA